MPRPLRAILLLLIPSIYVGATLSFIPHATSLMENMSAFTVTLLIGFCILLTYGAYKLFEAVKNS